MSEVAEPGLSRRARRRAAFLQDHPRCCFCYGERPTAEIDHAPARACFRGKEGPEGFVFPSCSLCNRASAHSEQVAALYIRFTDNTPENFREEDFVKLFWGVANNTPGATPSFTPETARRIDAGLDGFDGPPGELVIPRAAHKHLELFATKILYAMYYRLSGDFAGPRNRRLVLWAQAGTPAAAEVEKRAEGWFGEHVTGKRRNVDLGNQFRLRYGYNSAHGFLGLSLHFSRALVFFCVLGPSKSMATLKPRPQHYQPIWQLGLRLQRRSI